MLQSAACAGEPAAAAAVLSPPSCAADCPLVFLLIGYLKAVRWEPYQMMLRGWSPFADDQGNQIPLKNRSFLDSQQCGKIVEIVVKNVSASLWGLVESVRHDSQRNRQIVLTRRPDSRTSLAGFLGCIFEVWPALGVRKSPQKGGGRQPPHF